MRDRRDCGEMACLRPLEVDNLRVMARLRDFPRVVRKIGAVTFARRVWSEVEQDSVFIWASSLAYSWILALFPFLIFLLTLIPYLPEHTRKDALKQLDQAIHQFPTSTRQIIEDFIHNRLDDLQQGQKSLLTIGLGVTLWAASGGMAATSAALDRAWDVDEKRNFFKRRFYAVFLTVVVSVLLMTIVFLLPVVTWLRRRFLHYTRWEHGIAMEIVDVARWLLAIWVMFLVIEVVYYFGTNIKQRWRWMSPGSVFCVMVWVGLGLAFRFYVDRYGKYNQTYGAVGGVAVLLLNFYFDAIALLIGAEINSEIDYELLSLPRGARDFRGEPRKISVPAGPGSDPPLRESTPLGEA